MSYIGDAIVRTGAVSSCYFPEEHNCSVLTCPIEPGVDLTIHILRCAHPPAMRVTIGSGFQTLFDHTFNRSEIVPVDLVPGGEVGVTLDQLCPSDIGFQVSHSLWLLCAHLLSRKPGHICWESCLECTPCRLDIGPHSSLNCLSVLPCGAKFSRCILFSVLQIPSELQKLSPWNVSISPWSAVSVSMKYLMLPISKKCNSVLCNMHACTHCMLL